LKRRYRVADRQVLLARLVDQAAELVAQGSQLQSIEIR
jgi:hypothetical protein